MVCCLCGETIQVGDYYVSLNQNRAIVRECNIVGVQVPFEDGSFKKNAHSICPAFYGAPLALIGAQGDRSDV